MEQENTTAQAPTSTSTPVATPITAEKNTDAISDHKLWAILGYILPFLFFIPMLDDTKKNNPYVRVHADQQLTLLGLWVLRAVLFNMFFMLIPFGLIMISSLINLAFLVLTIIGIINAAQGKTKALPLIGGISFIDTLFKK